MDKSKIIIGLVGGAAIGWTAYEEGHREAQLLREIFAAKPAASVPVYCCNRHGPEPESPTGPLRLAEVAPVSTSTAARATLADYSSHLLRSTSRSS
jgi:hypothetical protein